MAEFSWAAAGDVGTGLMGGLSAGLNAMGKAEVMKANAKSQQLAREGGNEVARSAGKLAETVRGINNNRLLEAAGGQLDTLTTAAVRTSDSFTKGKFEDSIRSAEQWGAASAQASSQGLGGAGIRAIGITSSLQIARRQHELEERGDQATSDAANASTGLMARTLQSLQVTTGFVKQRFGADSAISTPNLGLYLLNGALQKQDSLKTMLGSLYTQPDNSSPAPESAVSTPVERGSANGTPLSNFNFEVSPYEDVDRFRNRALVPYEDTQRLLNRSTSNL